MLRSVSSAIRKNMKVSHFLGVFICTSLLSLNPLDARADDWPTSTVSIVVPYSPGGNTDNMARLLAEHLTKKLGQRFIVENRGGAAGAIGTAHVVESKPDGNALLFASGSQIVLLPLLDKANYDPDKDLIPISIMGDGPYILGVRKSLPIANLEEFVSYAKEHPGELDYGTSGVGGLSHLLPALFGSVAGIDLTMVAFKGSGPASAALISEEVDMYFGPASSALQHARDGSIKLVAVSSTQPMPDFPEVQTVASLYPGFRFTSWNGLFAPAGTPKAVIQVLEREMRAASNDPGISSKLAAMGLHAIDSTSEEFKETIEADFRFYADAIAAAGLKAE